MTDTIVDGLPQKSRLLIKEKGSNMLALFLLFTSNETPKIIYQPIYIFNPIVMIVSDKCNAQRECEEFIGRDQNITWEEIK